MNLVFNIHISLINNNESLSCKVQTAQSQEHFESKKTCQNWHSLCVWMNALLQMAIKRSFNVENRHFQHLRKDKNIIRNPKMKKKDLNKVNFQASTSAITVYVCCQTHYPCSRDYYHALCVFRYNLSAYRPTMQTQTHPTHSNYSFNGIQTHPHKDTR